MNAVADKTRDTYIVGLRNQHAVENRAIELLERQVGRLENYPEMRERMQHHLEESREQARHIENLLSSLGTSHSTMKDTAISFVGNMMAIGHTTTSDEVVKNTFANYAFEHYEMAAYMSLLDLLIRLATRPGCRPLIPRLSDQNQWAQSRMPRDMIFQD